MARKSRAKPPSPFRCFNSSPEVIRLVVLMYVRFALSLRNVEDLLYERGIDLCHETVRFCTGDSSIDDVHRRTSPLG
jgi:putative transposase